MDSLKQQVQRLERDVATIRYLLAKKTGIGSDDVRANIVQPSDVQATIAASTITNTMMADDAIKQAELDYEVVAVTVSAGASTGTGTVTSGSIVLGYRPTGNNDQFVDNVSISGTTLTITLAANATADNTFSVVLLKS